MNAENDSTNTPERILALMKRATETPGAQHALRALAFGIRNQGAGSAIVTAIEGLADGRMEPIDHLNAPLYDERGKGFLRARAALLDLPLAPEITAEDRDAAADGLLGESMRSALYAAADRGAIRIETAVLAQFDPDDDQDDDDDPDDDEDGRDRAKDH